MRGEYAFSERRACELVLLAVSSYRYRSRRSDAGLRARLVELAREKPRWGNRRLHALLQRRGEAVNHKRVQRVYREAGLGIRRKARKRLQRTGPAQRVLTGRNQEWALDFVHDAVESGRAIRVLSVVDVYTRECLALEVDISFASWRVTRVLEGIIAERGAPGAIRCDNGPELTSRHFLAWCVERKIAAWRKEHNEERPHSNLAYRTPEEFARECGSQTGCGKDGDWVPLGKRCAFPTFPQPRRPSQQRRPQQLGCRSITRAEMEAAQVPFGSPVKL